MTIGQEDTDLLYDRHIKPAIRDVSLLPIRVDRVLHNDRIDHRIRLEIERADVVVADLTYARPSVYWEAGFAERKVPVVYTCRADHLSTKARRSDDALTVHFDLRNANIVTWRGTGSQTFQRQLKKRLRFVTKDLIAERELEEELMSARKAFAALSPSERCRDISAATSALFARAAFATLAAAPTPRFLRSRDRALGTPQILKAKLGGTLVLAILYPCVASLAKTGLEHHESNSVIGSYGTDDAVMWDGLPDEIKSLGRAAVKRLRRIKIVPVLGKIPQSKLEDAMPTWRAAGPAGWYYQPDQYESRYPRDEPVLPSSYEIIVIQEVKSRSEYIAKLAPLIAQIRSSPTENIREPSPAA
jgi:nucleoside 2-deoxyribosyltransferase